MIVSLQNVVVAEPPIKGIPNEGRITSKTTLFDALIMNFL